MTSCTRNLQLTEGEKSGQGMPLKKFKTVIPQQKKPLELTALYEPSDNQSLRHKQEDDHQMR